MKASIYNSILEVGSYKLVYNAWNDRSVCVKAEALTHDNLASVTDTVLQQQLQEIGAVIDDDIDEVKRLTKLIDQTDNNDSFFHLHINPTLDCNFNCWYCYENHLAGSRMNESTLNAVLRLVDRVFEEKKDLRHFSLSFFGGEPLMYFDKTVKPLVDYISEKCYACGVGFNVHFTSNGFLLNDTMIDYLSQKNCSFQITFDGHRQQHDKTRHTSLGHGSYDIIMNNIAKLTKLGIEVIGRINFTSENIESVPYIADDLKLLPAESKSYLRIDLQHVWQDIDKSKADDIDSLIENLSEKFRSLGFGVSSHLRRGGVRSSCYGDKRNHILVNYNGEIHRCTARDFTSENSYGHLLPNGSIEWKTDKLNAYLNCKFTRPECHRFWKIRSLIPSNRSNYVCHQTYTQLFKHN